VDQLEHNPAPAAIDHHPVIRLNRDRVYRAAIVDVPEGATRTRLDSGGPYILAMVVGQVPDDWSKPQPGGG
jgi:hypothetical protein